MRDGTWMEDLEETEPGPRPPGRRRVLAIVGLAAVPWVVVVAMLAGGADRSGDDASAVDDRPSAPPVRHPDEADPRAREPDTADHGEPGADPSPAPGLDDPVPSARGPVDAGLEVVEFRSRWRPEPGPEEAAALAVVVARAWLTGVDPPLQVDAVEPELPDGYAEHLVVEAVERPAPEAAVVTLLAIVLDGESELRTRVRRLAVPIVWEHDGPRPGGSPWWLPGPNLDTIVPGLEAIDDPADHLAAVDALTRAGYTRIDVKGLGRTRGWPVVAEVEARTPAGTTVSGDLWLRPHQGRLVVAGTTLSTSPEHRGLDDRDAGERARPDDATAEPADPGPAIGDPSTGDESPGATEGRP